MKQRVLVSCLLGLCFGLLAFMCCRITHLEGGDFGLSWLQAKELLAGHTPYPGPKYNQIWYPFPAVLFAVPLTALTGELAGALFFGFSCGLLSYFITAEGWNRLLIFTSLPFVSSLMVVQWQPFLMASVFIPWLGAMAFKPQIGFACALHSHRWSAFWSAVLWGLASLAIRPTWPIEFLQSARTFSYFIPLFYLAGPIMLLSIAWWKDRDFELLLLMSVAPQRFVYDAFVLWLIPKTTGELIFASALSWAGLAVFAPLLPWQSYDIVWRMSLLFFYLPMFLMLMRRKLSELRAVRSTACSQ